MSVRYFFQEGKLGQMEEELSQEGDSLLQLGRQLLQKLHPRPLVTPTDPCKSAVSTIFFNIRPADVSPEFQFH